MALPLIVGGAATLIAAAGACVLETGKNVAEDKKLKEPPNPNDPVFGSVAKRKLEEGFELGGRCR